MFQNNINQLTTEEYLKICIDEFLASPERRRMLDGEQYYRVDNDIENRKMYRYEGEEKKAVEDTTKANNRLAHGVMHLHVEDKVNYLLAKPYTLSCDNEQYVQAVDDVLGKRFQSKVRRIGVEASNKGIGWMLPYISAAGDFKVLLAPAEQCIPLWQDNDHEELDGLIYFYDVEVWIGKQRDIIRKVEYMTAENTQYFVQIDGELKLDSERYLKRLPDGTYEDIGYDGHYEINDSPGNWGKVPAIPWKNNDFELPDLKFIKALIDDYDKSRSDVSNTLEEIRSIVFGLKGYGGEDLGQFMRDLSYYRAVLLDEDGALEQINSTIDIAAAKEHFVTLRDDIYAFGQAVDKNPDKVGNSPSGIALKFMYSGLDLKCNSMEDNFQWSFDQLMYFVAKYMEITGKGAAVEDDISIVFNRDIQINETEAVSNCSSSKGVISDQTIIENHPFVTDAKEEMERIKEQEKNQLETDMFASANQQKEKEEVDEE